MKVNNFSTIRSAAMKNVINMINSKNVSPNNNDSSIELLLEQLPESAKKQKMKFRFPTRCRISIIV